MAKPKLSRLDWGLLSLLGLAAFFFFTTQHEYRVSRAGRILQTGEPLPYLVLHDSTGSPLVLSEIPGTIAIVVYGMCDSCFEEVPIFNTVSRRTKADSLRVIGVFSSGIDAYRQFTSRESVEFPTYFFPGEQMTEVVKALRIRRLGQVYLATDGLVIRAFENPLGPESLRDFIEVFGLSREDVAFLGGNPDW